MCESFFVAPFAPDGELVGVAAWDLASLSPRWLSLCEAMIRSLGPNFRSPLAGPLGHLEVRLTSAAGTGLGTFLANGRLMASAAYQRGADVAVEQEVVRMFIESLRRAAPVQHATTSDQPFEAMATLRDRPLQIVVPWADPAASAQDEQLVRELANHFAAAFLCCLD